MIVVVDEVSCSFLACNGRTVFRVVVHDVAIEQVFLAFFHIGGGDPRWNVRFFLDSSLLFPSNFQSGHSTN